MKVPPMVPSARERVDAAYNRWDDPDDPACNIEDIHAEAMEQAFRDGYAAGFAAVLGMLREPNIDLVTWVASGIWEVDAGWRGLWQEASLQSKEDYIACARAALPAAAAALADSADKSTQPSPQE
jgi:hypothetical protein